MTEELIKEFDGLEKVLDTDKLFLTVIDSNSLLNGLSIQRRGNNFVLGYIQEKSVLQPLTMFREVSNEFTSLNKIELLDILKAFKKKSEYLKEELIELKTHVIIKHKRNKR